MTGSSPAFPAGLLKNGAVLNTPPQGGACVTLPYEYTRFSLCKITIDMYYSVSLFSLSLPLYLSPFLLPSLPFFLLSIETRVSHTLGYHGAISPDPGIHGHPRHHSKFEASVNSMSPCLQ